jgi:hypothetical protein
MYAALIFFALSALISISSIVVSIYLIMGLISPQKNLNFEKQLGKYFPRMKRVILLDSDSYIRQRNTRLLMWLILISSAITLVRYVSFNLFSNR